MENPQTLRIDSLPNNWCDKDIVILHACFQLLSDCIEKEKLFTGHIDWTYSEEHIFAKEELIKLYNWWNKRKEQTDDLDEEQYNEDNQMIIKLIRLRKYLWT